MTYFILLYILSALIVGTHIAIVTLKINPFTYIGGSIVRSVLGMFFCTLCPLVNTYLAADVIRLSIAMKNGKKGKGISKITDGSNKIVISNDISSLYPSTHFHKKD